MAQVAGRWALVRARTGESAGTVQTLAGSTGDFVPFSCRALCLTRLMGKESLRAFCYCHFTVVPFVNAFVLAVVADACRSRYA